MNNEQALSQAKLYIRQNQKDQAREILFAILRENPNNDDAWILSAQVCDELGQVLYCLRRASKLNPKILETQTWVCLRIRLLGAGADQFTFINGAGLRHVGFRVGTHLESKVKGF